jgi:hypothetical protein
MQAKNLNDLFAAAKGTSTLKGSEARVTKFFDAVAGVDGRMNYVILHRADGTFVPVLFLNDKTMHLMHLAIKLGCCVTN